MLVGNMPHELGALLYLLMEPLTVQLSLEKKHLYLSESLDNCMAVTV